MKKTKIFTIIPSVFFLAACSLFNQFDPQKKVADAKANFDKLFESSFTISYHYVASMLKTDTTSSYENGVYTIKTKSYIATVTSKDDVEVFDTNSGIYTFNGIPSLDYTKEEFINRFKEDLYENLVSYDDKAFTKDNIKANGEETILDEKCKIYSTNPTTEQGLEITYSISVCSKNWFSYSSIVTVKSSSGTSSITNTITNFEVK